MLRNIAGIMADEEPKTPISASGLYNSSIFNVDAVFSSTILGGLSDFTIMNWFYISPPNPLDFYTQSYVEFGSSVNINPIRVFENKVDVSITNSSGGNIFITYPYTTPVDEWIHIAVTGSVTNNKVTLYINGVEVASTVMTYSIATGSTSGLMSDTSYASRAQLNIYNRELSEAEVLEHYVYDDDLMTSGVLGFDAMTPAQKSGLIYSSSFIKDISISGNEFKDKSGNGVTLSPQPSLTGDQIYVYTDASDLPSDTTVYDVNSSRIGSSFQGYNAGNPAGLQLTTAGSVYAWVRAESPGVLSLILSKSQYTGDQQGYELRTQNSKYLVSVSSDGAGGGSATQISTTSNVTSATYTLVGFEYDGSTLSISYDGQVEASTPYTGGIHNSTAPFMVSGYGGSNEGEFPFDGSVFQPLTYKRGLSQAERDAIFNGGTPICFNSMIANQPSLSDAEYAPRLGNWGANTGQETVDQSGNGVITTPIGSPTYTDQGLEVECTS